MSKFVLFRVLVFSALSALAFDAVNAQETAPPPAWTQPAAAAERLVQETEKRKVMRRTQTPPARVTVIPSQPPTLPQVVTVVHRLSGLKVLKLFLRQGGQNDVVETIDPVTITNDAHASVIAGWVLEDGKTIAARLPQAAAEVDTQFDMLFWEEKARAVASTPFSLTRTRVEPDLTVVTADGRKLRARLIGLDAETGLSVLEAIGPIAPATSVTIQKADYLTNGVSVAIFAPEPVKPEGEAGPHVTYVKVGKLNASVVNLADAAPGVFDRLTIRGEKFSPTVVGGVVCDTAGHTVGIVEAVEGSDARVLGTETIRAATRRVIERQASVPRPLLGVRGEPVELASQAAFFAHGWHEDQWKELVKAQLGILLTSVVPRSPAAQAKLRAGDVILRVNDFEVKTAQEFSKLLGDAGSGVAVHFTIRRPDIQAPFSVPVTLGRSFGPMFEWHFEIPRMTTFFTFGALGLETMELTPKAAATLGAQRGVIVVSVLPESAAARGGVREGDVIESFDGRIADRLAMAALPAGTQKKHTLWIVRAGEKKKLQVDLEE